MIASTWLTATRTRRLATILAAIPGHRGLPADEARLRLWRQCGGHIDEVPLLVDVLISAELVAKERDTLKVTRGGRNVITRRNVDGLRPLGLSLLRSGLLHDQARVLLELGSRDSDGNLICATRMARQRCPQLLGILEFWPGVVASPVVQVPRSLVQELQTVWALLPPSSPEEAANEAIRTNIGNRGELYSYQFERLNASDEADIVWVARDDSNLGYDIEDRSTDPRRRIEVKGSGGTIVRFLISDNEWRKAREYGISYEIHFWGGIDLNTQAADEYVRLRSQGYPLIFPDPHSLVTAGRFRAAPTQWRVEEVLGILSLKCQAYGAEWVRSPAITVCLPLAFVVRSFRKSRGPSTSKRTLGCRNIAESSAHYLFRDRQCHLDCGDWPQFLGGGGEKLAPRQQSGGFDTGAAAVRLPAIGPPSQVGPISPMKPPRGVPVSNPPRLRDFPGFLRPLVFAFRASRPASEASCAGAKRERSCAGRVGGASGPSGPP